MEDDLQELYANKELKKEFKRVPLAADAAHLLAEYLDTLAIELVRNGFLEPYQVTSEYESIIVSELERKGTDHKLTYDVVARVLESFGSPPTVVKDYIRENKPRLKPLLTTPREPEPTVGKAPIPTKPVNFWDGLEMSFGYIILAWVLIANVITITQYYLSLSTYSQDEYLFSIIAGWIFIAYELFNGFTGRLSIDLQIYRRVRPFIKTSFLLSTIISSVPAIDGSRSHDQYQFGFIFILSLTIAVYFVTFLRDVSPLFYSVRENLTINWVQYILPSYLLTYFCLGMAYLALYFHREQNFNHSINSGPLVPIVLILSIISVFMDRGRKYPVSLHRILIIGTIPYFVLRTLTFSTVGYLQSETIHTAGWDDITIIIMLFVWVIFYVMASLSVYRLEIRGELDKLHRGIENELEKLQQNT